MAYYNNPGQINDEAINIAGGKTFQVVQVADISGNVTSPYLASLPIVLSGLGIPSHDSVELTYTSGKITTIIYKSSSSTVATVSITYNAEGDLFTITKA
jgi:hypothetical protein